MTLFFCCKCLQDKKEGQNASRRCESRTLLCDVCSRPSAHTCKNLRFYFHVYKLAFDFSPVSLTLRSTHIHTYYRYTPAAIYTHYSISSSAYRPLLIRHPPWVCLSCIYMHMCCLIRGWTPTESLSSESNLDCLLLRWRRLLRKKL